jgi:hypothetical protein
MKCAILLILTLLVLSNLEPATCYGWKSVSELWDLEYNGDQLVAEVDAWSATLLINPKIKTYNCGGTYVMGGFNVLGGTKNQYWERTYTGLPAHNQLDLTYTVYAIDSWDGTGADDHYEVSVDDYTQRGWRFSSFTGLSQPVCGSGSWGEYPPVLAISTFIHSGSTVRIRFINMLDQASNDESLGIRDIKLKFVNVATPSNSLCGRSTANVALPDWPCPKCDTSHQYMGLPASGTCYECADSCATCNAKGASGCTSCYSGNYISGTTCNSCSSNCATCTGSASYCTTCPSAMFMASNVCYTNCMFPLSVSESGGITYCNSPCSGNQYAMWDGTCSSTCLPELTPTTMSSFRVCTFPCSVNPITV